MLDNASADNSCQIIKEKFPAVNLIESGQNLGFGAGHNKVFNSCSRELLLLLNPDAWLMEGALDILVDELLKDDKVALVAPRMDYANGAPQLSFGKFPSLIADMRQKRMTQDLRIGHPSAQFLMEQRLKSALSPDWVSGACFLARREAMKSVGCFDESYFLYLEDVDLCKRLRQNGWQIILQPLARCRHLEGHSHEASSDSTPHFRRSRLIYLNKFASNMAFRCYKFLRGKDIELDYDPALRVK